LSEFSFDESENIWFEGKVTVIWKERSLFELKYSDGELVDLPVTELFYKPPVNSIQRKFE